MSDGHDPDGQRIDHQPGADQPGADQPGADQPDDSEPVTASVAPRIAGDVVFGDMDSTVAVCTLASRSLLPALAGRAEIAVAGRVFTENVGVEKMVQNLLAFGTIRYLILCGRETAHRVGETILCLHRFGLDANSRAIGSDAPEPVMPNLTPEQVRAFQERVELIDLRGVVDAVEIVRRAAELSARAPAGAPGAPPVALAEPVEEVQAARDPVGAWEYDPAGFFLVFVDRAGRRLRLEQYDRDHHHVRTITGRNAEEICHTVLRLGQVTLLAHAAYLGRELAKAEAALALGLDYDQDRPLRPTTS